MLRFLSLVISLAVAAGFVPGALPHNSVVRASSASTPTMAIPDRFRKGKKVKNDPTPSDVYGEVEVDAAASEIEKALEKPKFKAQPPKPKAKADPIKIPDVSEVDVDEVIVATMKGSKAVFEKSKEALDAAIEFEKENDVSTKAKDAFSMVVDFWKENEIGLKARAIGEIIVEEASKVDVKVPSTSKKATKAKASKDVTKTKSKPAKTSFEMPKFEMPKFDPKKKN